jgi:hypothetical protein
MKSEIVKFSEISKHPTNRLDANYWVGKKEGKKAFKKKEKGEVVEDDLNGKIMLTEREAEEYNAVNDEANIMAKKLKDLKDKYNVKE